MTVYNFDPTPLPVNLDIGLGIMAYNFRTVDPYTPFNYSNLLGNTEEDYNNMIWGAGNPIEKPPLADVIEASQDGQVMLNKAAAASSFLADHAKLAGIAAGAHVASVATDAASASSNSVTILGISVPTQSSYGALVAAYNDLASKHNDMAAKFNSVISTLQSQSLLASS